MLWLLFYWRARNLSEVEDFIGKLYWSMPGTAKAPKKGCLDWCAATLVWSQRYKKTWWSKPQKPEWTGLSALLMVVSHCALAFYTSMLCAGSAMQKIWLHLFQRKLPGQYFSLPCNWSFWFSGRKEESAEASAGPSQSTTIGRQYNKLSMVWTNFDVSLFAVTVLPRLVSNIQGAFFKPRTV